MYRGLRNFIYKSESAYRTLIGTTGNEDLNLLIYHKYKESPSKAKIFPILTLSSTYYAFVPNVNGGSQRSSFEPIKFERNFFFNYLKKD